MLTSFHFILLQFAVGISPIIHLVWSLKILRNLGFQFLLGITVVPREIEDDVYAKNLEGGEGGKQGVRVASFTDSRQTCFAASDVTFVYGVTSG